MKHVLVPCLAALLLATAGCGGKKIVPVTGVVKLNGKPYKNAVVSFQPIGGSMSDPDVGRGSSAVTDANGHFSMIYDGEKPGALIGKHRVRIFTRLGAEPSTDDGVESPKGSVKPQRMSEPIPIEWHDKSTKEFEVPAGGTDAANFDIETKGKG